jgi:hypothetical protein
MQDAMVDCLTLYTYRKVPNGAAPLPNDPWGDTTGIQLAISYSQHGPLQPAEASYFTDGHKEVPVTQLSGF